MKIFYYFVFVNLICTRYLNFEKLESNYHNDKSSKILRRKLEGDENLDQI